VPRTQCSSVSAFTRVFDALWQCTADPGSTLMTTCVGPGSAEQRELRCTVSGREIAQLLISADQVFSISLTTGSGIGM
jgi:hypothetical protein